MTLNLVCKTCYQGKRLLINLERKKGPKILKNTLNIFYVSAVPLLF